MLTGTLRWDAGSSPTDLAHRVEEWGVRLAAALVRAANAMAGRIERWMKANAPWTNRTGDARARLSAWVVRFAAGVTIVLAHGVDYGKWLEIAHAGRFAIVAPAVRFWTPIFMQEIDKSLRRASR